MGQFYDGGKLLSLVDINGELPELYICTSNRSAGKTTFFGRYLVKKFLSKGEKFCLLYRYSYEISDVADKFFKDIGQLFFPNFDMVTKSRARGIYHELFLRDATIEDTGINCGYAISLNSADQIKKYSHLLSDVQTILFDEFQSETNHYCSNEIQKFISVHTSIARGQGKQVRRVPVIMLSNTVTLLNPYYIQLGIANRLKKETKFLRGEGYVLEQGNVESASISQKSSAFNRAFSSSEYVAYSAQSIYLNDNETFVEKIEGRSRYICTLKYLGCEYAIREYVDKGILYCDKRPDISSPNKITVTTNDHDINFVMLKRYSVFLESLRYYFNHGCFRFKDLSCKDAVLKALSF